MTETTAGSWLSALRSLAFWKAFLRLNVGLYLFGVAIAIMLEARIGLDPWSTFHEGLSQRSGLSFGRVSKRSSRRTRKRPRFSGRRRGSFLSSSPFGGRLAQLVRARA